MPNRKKQKSTQVQRISPITIHLMKLQAQHKKNVASTSNKPNTGNQGTKKSFRWLGFADKTMWDWLNLIAVLLVPVVLGYATLQFTAQQNTTSLQFTSQQNKAALNLQQDQQREAVLTHYMDDISSLLIDNNLRDAKDGSPIQRVAIMKTVSAIRRLDSPRNKELLAFLMNEHLLFLSSNRIYAVRGVINLTHTDLSGAQLSFSNLAFINLSKVDFSKANLANSQLFDADLTSADLYKANLSASSLNSTNFTEANLSDANLSYTILDNADLANASLSSANLSYAHLHGVRITPQQLSLAKTLKGATLPDGSKYPSKSWPIPNGPKD